MKLIVSFLFTVTFLNNIYSQKTINTTVLEGAKVILPTGKNLFQLLLLNDQQYKDLMLENDFKQIADKGYITFCSCKNASIPTYRYAREVGSKSQLTTLTYAGLNESQILFFEKAFSDLGKEIRQLFPNSIISSGISEDIYLVKDNGKALAIILVKDNHDLISVTISMPL